MGKIVKAGEIKAELSVRIPLWVRCAIFGLGIFAAAGGRFDPDRVAEFLARHVRIIVK